MNNVLVKWYADWSDEFVTSGFITTTQEKWEQYVSSLVEEDVGHLYFGTNEGWDDMTLEEYLSHCTVVSLSAEERRALVNLFGSNIFPDGDDPNMIRYGIFPLVWDKDVVLY